MSFLWNLPFCQLELTLIRIDEFSQGRWCVLIGPWTDCNFVCTVCNLRRILILLVWIDRSGFTWCNYENVFTTTTRTWSIVKWIIDLGLKNQITMVKLTRILSPTILLEWECLHLVGKCSWKNQGVRNFCVGINEMIQLYKLSNYAWKLGKSYEWNEATFWSN